MNDTGMVHQHSKLLRARTLMYVLPLLIAGGLLALAITWRPEIAAITPPDPASFPPALVERGAMLAKLGDCAVCHTAEGGRPLAGARPLATPFGTLYSNNITSDPETGIGRWSPAAFRRAMREGVSRTGSHLYPALPYEHYTHVTDGDLDALYAFLMSRRRVVSKAPDNELIFPLGFRPLLAGWKMLFLHRGPVSPDPRQSAAWNRGAYLAEGLGHCGGCHTPRNIAGGEERGRAYSGGVAEGWKAPALDAINPAARRWTAKALYTFLRTGVSPDHSAAGGPMAAVTESLSGAPDADVRALAVYFAFKMAGRPVAEPAARPIDRHDTAARMFPDGATLFEGACAGCHGTGAPMLGQGRPALGLATDVVDDDPTSAIQAVLRGVQPPVANRGPKMPPFAESLSDAQVAAVLGYARTRFSTRPPWPRLAKKVKTARKESSVP